MKSLSTVAEIAGIIDHSLLAPSATLDDVLETAEEGKRFGVAAVCVNPVWVKHVASTLKGSDVECCVVAGFPLGAHYPEVVTDEAVRAVDLGATEIDMVMNIGLARMGRWIEVVDGIDMVRNAIGNGIVLKVILEVCELTQREIIDSTRAAIEGGADFIKTSTGFGRHGATEESVRLITKTADGHARVKAAGGIRTLEQLRSMVKVGADRIGTSATGKILDEAEKEQE